MRYIFPVLIFLFSCSTGSQELLDESEYRKFGKHIIQLINQSNVEKLTDTFYPKYTFQKLEDTIRTSGFNDRVNSAKWKAYRIELQDHFREYITIHTNRINDSSNIELSKFYIKNNTAHLIITMQSNNEFEVTDFELFNIGGKIYITNFQTYNTGINLSDLFIWDAVNKLHYGWRGGEYISALEELNNSYVYLTRNQPERAWNAYQRIPEYFEYQSHFQNIKCQIAFQLSDSLFEQVLLEWIGNNWDNKGFRYIKGYTYFVNFGDSTKAGQYRDSLIDESGSKMIETILGR